MRKFKISSKSRNETLPCLPAQTMVDKCSKRHLASSSSISSLSCRSIRALTCNRSSTIDVASRATTRAVLEAEVASQILIFKPLPRLRTAPLPFKQIAQILDSLKSVKMQAIANRRSPISPISFTTSTWALPRPKVLGRASPHPSSKARSSPEASRLQPTPSPARSVVTSRIQANLTAIPNRRDSKATRL